MSLGSSSLKCAGVRSIPTASVEVATGHLHLFCLHAGERLQMSVCLWFGKRMLHSRRLSHIRTLTTYPENLPLIRKGGKMAPGS